MLAFRQYNWLTSDAPSAAQASIVMRGYKFGEYLAPYMSSFEAEERLSFGSRWGATLFAGVAGLYGEGDADVGRPRPLSDFRGGHSLRDEARRSACWSNLEVAQGIEDNRGVFLKFGYAW